MHFTDADGRVTISVDGTTRVLCADQNLPTTIGTTGSATLQNACVMEIVNVVERAGLTVETSAANDLTNGYKQMETAIFDSAAIDTTALAALAVTDAKINDMTLTKLTDGKCFISEDQGGSITYSLTIDSSPVSTPPEIELSKSDASGSPVVVNTTEINVNDGFYSRQIEDGVVTEKAKLHTDGIEFQNSVKVMRHTSIDFSSASWSGDTGTVTSTIPADAIVLMAAFTYKAGNTWNMLPAYYTTIEKSILITFEENGGVLDASVYAPGQILPASYDEIWMTVLWAEE